MELGKILKSRALCVVLTIVSLFVCVVIVYAIRRDAEISFSRDGLLRISPKGNERIKELEERLAKVLDEYRSISSKYEQIVKIVGADMENSDGVVSAIQLMYARFIDLKRDTNYSLSVIRSEVYRSRTINTQSLAMNQATVDLYIHIQKFFRAVGIYNGEIDGDQAVTCSAVRQFQAEYDLDVDGIIGEKTLAVMERVFEEAKEH